MLTLIVKLLKNKLIEDINWLNGLDTKILDQHTRGYIDGKLRAFKEILEWLE